MPPSSIPTIAIVGAGPAGLTLLRLLSDSPLYKTAKSSLVLYERDASATSRATSGGTLDLHHDTGLAALRKCGLMEQFRAHARYDGDEITMADKNRTVLVWKPGGGSKEGDEDARPEIDRRLLQDMLLKSVPEENVRWGAKVKEVTEGGMVEFEGRREAEGPFDLVVGADGAWSRVRGRLTNTKPCYAGVSGYEADILAPAKTCPHVHKMVGKGGWATFSDGKALNAQRMGDGSLKVRNWFPCPEHEAQTLLDADGAEATIQKIMARHRGWAPEVLDFFRHADVDSLRVWPLYELPVGEFWEHREGFTLIGDAASLATPFSGEGVNKAMQDSLELAALIEESCQDPSSDLTTLDQAVRRYEQAMFPRAEKMQAFTITNKDLMFGSAGPIGIITGLIKQMTRGSGSRLVQLAGSAPVLAALGGCFWGVQQVGWAVRVFWRRT